MTAGPVQKAVVRPARGTRPPNRRQLIIDAATDLFCRKGYANVAMGDVAEAVAIGPSALYRHFRGKQDLLATVVGAALDTLDDAFTAAEDERLARCCRRRLPPLCSGTEALGCCGIASRGSSPRPTAGNSGPRSTRSPHGSPHSSAHAAPPWKRWRQSCLPGRGSRSRPACRCTASSCPNPNSLLC